MSWDEVAQSLEWHMWVAHGGKRQQVREEEGKGRESGTVVWTKIHFIEKAAFRRLEAIHFVEKQASLNNHNNLLFPVTMGH